MKGNRRQGLLKYLKLFNLVFTKIGIPREFYNDLQIFCEICAVQGIQVPKFFTFIFGLGYELMLNFYQRADVKTIPQMLTLVRYMRSMFDEVLQYSGKEWFMDSKSFKVIIRLCKQHSIKINDLFTYIDQNREILLGEGKFLLTPAKVEAIIEYYLRRTV